DPVTNEGRHAMQIKHSRRRFLTTLSSAGAAGVLAPYVRPAYAEPPPEITRIRLAQIAGICVAPQYVAGELLKSEGCTELEYVSPIANPSPASAAGTIDLSMAFVAPIIVQADADMPVAILGGVHAGCFELFGTERVKAIRDLKGKTV